jgi:probable rRNA maturation factor
VAVNFFTENVAFPVLNRTKIRKWISLIAQNEDFKVGNISVVFVDDAYILQMNVDYLDHNYFTDIITFDYTAITKSGKKVSGDLFISLDTILKNSQDYGVSFHNELCRVIIHGILHLSGYHDKSDAEFDQMKRKEEECLAILQTIG